MIITEDKLIALKLQAESTNAPEYILKKLIEAHDTTEMERAQGIITIKTI